jgi:hypothetical protein
MGSMDQYGTSVKRKIKIVDTTGYTIAQLETAYNTNYGAKGWRLIGFVTISSKVYIVAEKEE